jgi:hypothetical protein
MTCMNPDEVTQVRDDLHVCIDQPSGETPPPVLGTDDWYQARQAFLADIAKLEDAWEHPQTDLRDASRAL